jgi:TolA-binding protein
VIQKIILFFALVIGTMVLFHQSLEDGSLVRYLDSHPDSQWVPAATYYLGDGYQIFQNLPEAATFYQRVVQKFPKHSLADGAAFSYVRCLDDMATIGRSDLIQAYQDYLEHYPKGKYVEEATQRLGVLQTSSR